MLLKRSQGILNLFKNKSSLTAAERLYNDFVLRFGFPANILHYQGREFENKLFLKLNRASSNNALPSTGEWES